MPPGSGKTMVALKIIEKLKVKTLIIVLKKACYEIWLNEIINNTNYKESDLSFNSIEDKTICIFTYQEAARMLCNYNNQWGLVIYDQRYYLMGNHIHRICY